MKFSRRTVALSLLSLLMLSFPTPLLAKAILGVDLGSLYMKVALVQRGAPLEIVTNLHSKRKTENMILFDAGTRFYGADASSLLARKPLKTPSAMSVLLGKEHDHPTVQVLAERHYPLTPSYNETRSGVCLTVDGIDFTPEELVAMVLTHAKDIAAAYGGEQGSSLGAIRDCVLTVPSFATQHERRALLDAAALADLNVLSLIDETTAAALHYVMDKLPEEPEILIFYNLGASSLQVSVVKLFSYPHKETKFGKEKQVAGLEVLGKAWDATLGGAAFDHVIVEFLADEFMNKYHGSKGDIRTNTRAMTKLRLQANKVKHVLSANTEIPIYVDALFDDQPLDTHLTRAHLENLAHELLVRAVAPVDEALKAANVTIDQVNGIELIGGGMRIPKVQETLQRHLGGHVTELGMHINSDESMALGAAFYGANISTAFRVRHVGMTDINPFAISVSLEDYVEDPKKAEQVRDGEEPWAKHATIFKSFGKLGVKKTIAFTHDKDVHCAIDYEENDILPKGTNTAIERYNVTGVETFAEEMEAKGLGKPKISLQFELSNSGITRLVKAEAAVEETVLVEEEVEVEEEDEKNATTEEGEGEKKDDATADAEKKDESGVEKEEDTAAAADKTEEEVEEASNETASTNETDSEKNETAPKARKTKMVQKEKKKVHKRSLEVETYYEGRVRPYSEELMEESRTKLDELARKDKERMMLEESRNKVESYIYLIKNKLVDDEEKIGKVSTEAQRAELSKLAADAEEWMYDDGYNADLATMEDKYAELSTPAEKVFGRVAEMTARPAAIESLREKLSKVEELMKKWETSMPQVTEEERKDVLDKVEEVRKWISEKEEEQAKADPTEDPVFHSTDVPLQTKSLETTIARLSRKPKPKPEKKNETKAESNETSAEANETSTDGNDTASTEEGEAPTGGEAADETKETEQDIKKEGEDEL